MNQDEAERVARALEETAALVRRCPPSTVDLNFRNEPITAPTGPLGENETVDVHPVLRFFRLDW